MTPFFRPPERQAALLAEAESWVGTPFFGNGASKGVGVSCQKLAWSLYRACGFGPEDVPDVPMSHARFSEVSLVTEFLQGRADFQLLTVEQSVGVGDLLTFRLPKAIHHVGVLVKPGVFVSALHGPGVALRPLADPTWRGRLAQIWRPLE